MHMRVFRYASDYYGDWLPQQVLWSAVVALNLLVVVFAGIHLMRRSLGHPVCKQPEISEAGRIRKYEPGARLYHWGNFMLMVVLALSGAALLVPGSLKPKVLGWLRMHEIVAAAFLAGTVFHAIVAPRRGDGRSMWFDARDWADLRLIFANFFGRTRAYPCFGKYDPLQKLYHALLALVTLVLAVTGLFLFASAENLASFGHPWMRWMRLLHDASSAMLVAVVIGHIYFGLIRPNWPELRAMFTGTVRWSKEDA